MYILKVIIWFLTINLVYGIEDLFIAECKRTINLQTQLTKIKYEFTLINNGTRSVTNFKWTSTESGRLTHMEATDSKQKILKITIDGESPYVIIELPKMIYNDSKKVIINEIYAKGIKPLPAEIKQHEPQRVVYISNIYIDTIYYVKKQTTIVILPTTNEETSYSYLKPTELKENQITYGPYEDIFRQKRQILKVHFLNNGPFLTVSEMKRKITVSHWGFINVEEIIKLVHSGAKLKGPFSRIDLQNDKQSSALNRITHIHTYLPVLATDIYYRDDIGNISTSIITPKKNYIKAVLGPRFLLMGGWKTSYKIGYKVPIYEYLFYNKSSNYFSLNMRFIDHIFNNMYVEKIETSIVLPVFAKVIISKLPSAVEVLPDSFVYNYLDWKPRQILSYVKYDLIENDIKDFQIIYEWSPMVFLYQPFLIVVFLYLIFLCVIFYIRLDFTLTVEKKKDKKVN